MSRGAFPEFRLYADESGNDRDTIQVLAGIGGEAHALELLELRLRTVLQRRGIQELKWAGLRTREKRLDAAREFLQLACEAAGEGKLWVDLLVFELPAPHKSWLALYQCLIVKAKGRKSRARWILVPDQRTGMPWKRLRKLAGLHRVEEASSKNHALIQLADLLAGLTRFSHERRLDTAERARLKRQKLLEEFLSMLEQRKLGKRAFKIWNLRNLRGVKHG